MNHMDEADIIYMDQRSYDNIKASIKRARKELREIQQQKSREYIDAGKITEGNPASSSLDDIEGREAAKCLEIFNLENTLRYARVEEIAEKDDSCINIGDSVSVKLVYSDGEVSFRDFTIVGSNPDRSKNEISKGTPIASAILSAKKGEVVTAKLNGGGTVTIHIFSKNNVSS